MGYSKKDQEHKKLDFLALLFPSSDTYRLIDNLAMATLLPYLSYLYKKNAEQEGHLVI